MGDLVEIRPQSSRHTTGAPQGESNRLYAAALE
jgi:hypothetical protein